MRMIVVLGLVFCAIAILGGPGANLSGLTDRLPALPEPIERLLPRSTPTPIPTPVPVVFPSLAPPIGGGTPVALPTVSREVVMTEAEVNRRIADAVAAGAPVPVQNLNVKLRGDNLVDFTGRATIAGITADLAATIALVSSGGQVAVEVRSAQAGPFPVPGGLVSQLAQQALGALGAGGPDNSRLPEGIDRVEVRPGTLVLIRQ